MSSVDNITVCEKCDKEYWYTFNLKTQQSYRTTECDCGSKEKSE